MFAFTAAAPGQSGKSQPTAAFQTVNPQTQTSIRLCAQLNQRQNAFWKPFDSFRLRAGIYRQYAAIIATGVDDFSAFASAVLFNNPGPGLGWLLITSPV